MNLRDLFLRIRAGAPHRVERELHEELAFHIERETQKRIGAGLSSVDARTRALARFGPVPLTSAVTLVAPGSSMTWHARTLPFFRNSPRLTTASYHDV